MVTKMRNQKIMLTLRLEGSSMHWRLKFMAQILVMRNWALTQMVMKMKLHVMLLLLIKQVLRQI